MAASRLRHIIVGLAATVAVPGAPAVAYEISVPVIQVPIPPAYDPGDIAEPERPLEQEPDDARQESKPTAPEPQAQEPAARVPAATQPPKKPTRVRIPPPPRLPPITVEAFPLPPRTVAEVPPPAADPDVPAPLAEASPIQPPKLAEPAQPRPVIEPVAVAPSSAPQPVPGPVATAPAANRGLPLWLAATAVFTVLAGAGVYSRNHRARTLSRLSTQLVSNGFDRHTIRVEGAEQPGLALRFVVRTSAAIGAPNTRVECLVKGEAA